MRSALMASITPKLRRKFYFPEEARSFHTAWAKSRQLTRHKSKPTRATARHRPQSAAIPGHIWVAQRNQFKREIASGHRSASPESVSKYPPAKPGALMSEPLKAARRGRGQGPRSNDRNAEQVACRHRYLARVSSWSDREWRT